MRKRTYITYDEMDVRKIVQDELKKTKPEWVKEFTQTVEGTIAKFKDEVMTAFDKVMGKFEAFEQEKSIYGAANR